MSIIRQKKRMFVTMEFEVRLISWYLRCTNVNCLIVQARHALMKIAKVKRLELCISLEVFGERLMTLRGTTNEASDSPGNHLAVQQERKYKCC